MNHQRLRAMLTAALLGTIAACGENPVQPPPVAPRPPNMNSAPVASLAVQAYGWVEGRPILFYAYGSYDPDRDALRYSWSFGDGQTASTYQVSHVYADQGNYLVRLTVTDPYGLSSSVSFTITIANATPYPGTLTAPALQEGVPFTLRTIGASDAPADLAAGLLYSFDCGLGYWTGFSLASSVTCPGLPDNGVYLLRVRVLDKDGAIKPVGILASVANVAPVLTVATYVQWGAYITATGGFADVRADWNSTLRFNWGDGTVTDLNPAVPGALYSRSHRYAMRGVYNLRIRVTDKDGGTTFVDTPVTVR